MPPTRLAILFERYLLKTATEAEKEEFFTLIADPAHTAALQSLSEQFPVPFEATYAMDETAAEEIMQAIQRMDHDQPGQVVPMRRNQIFRKRWWQYAAAILLIAGAGTWLYTSTRQKTTITETANHPSIGPEVSPGSDKAVLTLSNGQKVELTADSQQPIADGRLRIRNTDGAVRYEASDVLVYNTITTPKKGQYKLFLSDGTTVWLNAASSITYPTSFPGNDRTVSITGEVYFEVTKNAQQPFIVNTYRDVIRVLGTKFNVNAYPDEPAVKTSLLEGAVRIRNTLLQPGQAYRDGHAVNTNLEQDLAWKNGIFNFTNMPLQQALRSIAKWYDVEVIYEGDIPAVDCYGEIQRSLPLKDALEILSATGIQFRIAEGARLIVSKK